ncbi:hypothetical protein PoMZ_00075 [Pyricularia oryzae]|uniref:Uncharacterized protein n=1 Tax=Pyricularia oryzae TaxID=318829 RepID=A0A4P7N1C1_PYROR|nr:hypothetical protein PoMZ_00075 [Pyricularia oryzae]
MLLFDDKDCFSVGLALAYRLSLVSGAITTGLGQVVDTNNLLSTTPLETEEFAAPKQKKNEPVIVYDDYATAAKEFKAAHPARRERACGISRGGRLKKDNLEHVLTPHRRAQILHPHHGASPIRLDCGMDAAGDGRVVVHTRPNQALYSTPTARQGLSTLGGIPSRSRW